jgi:hypothetical protein
LILIRCPILFRPRRNGYAKYNKKDPKYSKKEKKRAWKELHGMRGGPQHGDIMARLLTGTCAAAVQIPRGRQLVHTKAVPLLPVQHGKQVALAKPLLV